MADDCLFCKIVAGEIPVERLREDDTTLIFPDINPQAPVHVLVISKQHYRDIGELATDPTAAAGVIGAIGAYTSDAGITDYRTVFNTGAAVGQSVFHVHAHILAGRPMGWPPG